MQLAGVIHVDLDLSLSNVNVMWKKTRPVMMSMRDTSQLLSQEHQNQVGESS
jgi:hypothetical protein